MEQTDMGIIGMGVMGRSLALNLAGKGVSVSIYNRHVPKLEEKVAHQVAERHPAYRLMAFDEVKAFLASLKRPRKILMMIPASAVDAQLAELLPLLDAGDSVADGGNSHFEETERRISLCIDKGIHFLGTGISGGEAGALTGPALMPSGPEEAYQAFKPFLDAIAAKDIDGNPCTSYIGPGGSGHYVKMVHNGIEYAEMQAIAEAYYILREAMQRTPEEIVQIFESWRHSGAASFLLDVTLQVLQKNDNDGVLLLDKILDQAAQKGTGNWSAIQALQQGVPYSPLTEAVTARYISARKTLRVNLAEKFDNKGELFTAGVDDLRAAYEATRIINHHIGFDLLLTASSTYQWNLNLAEIARIWTNGCIIKSSLMQKIWKQFSANETILDDPFTNSLQQYKKGWAETIAAAARSGLALPVMSAALNYFLGITTANSAANLIQAMRDFFGAHTYQRVDKPGEDFHTNWN